MPKNVIEDDITIHLEKTICVYDILNLTSLITKKIPFFSKDKNLLNIFIIYIFESTLTAALGHLLKTNQYTNTDNAPWEDMENTTKYIETLFYNTEYWNYVKFLKDICYNQLSGHMTRTLLPPTYLFTYVCTPHGGTIDIVTYYKKEEV